MRFTVQVLKENGEVENLRSGLTAEVAESISRHPSNGGRAVVVPDFAALPTGAAR